jgi:hypothetical protein
VDGLGYVATFCTKVEVSVILFFDTFQLIELDISKVAFNDHYFLRQTSKALSQVAKMNSLRRLVVGYHILSADMKESWEQLGSHLESIDVTCCSLQSGFEQVKYLLVNLILKAG